MEKTFIRKVNNSIREKRPCFSPDKLCDIFQSGDLLEIGFLSRQCKNDLSGSCLLCDYGRMNVTGAHQAYIDEMKDILKQYNNGIKYLLLCSNGSILDEYQIPTTLLKEILQIAQNCNIPEIIIETHYQNISIEKLNLIKQLISKPVTIEMGLETINPVYQETFFMKGIQMDLYKKTISLIQKYGYDIELNLMLGLPFLTPSEQIADAKKTIDWIQSCGCIPVVFPVNIKPHTMLRYMYDKGMYQPVSLWLLIFLLDILEPEVLEHVIIAWYGNRDESYPNDIPTVLPQCCAECKDVFARFARDFLDTNQYSIRKNLIRNLFTSVNCNCWMRIKEQIEHCIQTNFETNYKNFYKHLIKDFG